MYTHAAPEMGKDIATAQAALKNGRRYSSTFLALVAVRDWATVEELYPQLEDALHGTWPGCKEDKATLRQMAAADGYEITAW